MGKDGGGKSQRRDISEGRDQVVDIPVTAIEANPFQPRIDFDEETMAELIQSLSEHGLIQPVIVRPCPGGYQLIAGERRLRAAKQLGWKAIPAIVRELDDAASAQMALIENLQREDLNYWEEAEAYQRLLEEFGMTQEELARKIGKSQSAIANKLRLLKLSPRVRSRISREIMSERHCRALLALESEEAQLEVIEAIEKGRLSVKETEALVRRLLERDGAEKKPRQKVIRLWRDARLLQNSVRKLVEEMRAGGAVVELEEKQEPGVLEMRIRVKEKVDVKEEAAGGPVGGR
ncbi:MAG: ParB/RepB/Spo0J family partition protein [Firmicutes bacterium]|nr:ParB/RepB/Spo0J family partition protein [Bacillota bacterium]